MRELSLFTGAGGGLLGTHLLGWRTVCAVEWEPYCQAVLLARQADGILERFPIWDDVRTFKGADWRGKVDVITAGFPCQPFSTAGKRKGEADERNMWPDTIRVIREVGPEWCLLENVPGLVTSGYFGTILRDLAEAGFDAEWGVFSAAEVGAPHQRDRLWIVAHSNKNARCEEYRSKPNHWAEQLDGGGSVGTTDLAHTPRFLEGRQEQQPEWERTGVCGEPVIMANTPGPRHAPWRSGKGGQVWDETRGQESERRGGPISDSEGHRREPWGTEPEGQRGQPGVIGGGPTLADPKQGRRRQAHGQDQPQGGQPNFDECGVEVTDPDQTGQSDVCGLRTDAGASRGNQPNPDGGRPTLSRLGGVAYGLAAFMDGTWEDGIERVSRGVAHMVGRLKGIGNGQCPITLVKAWKTLSARFYE